MVVSKKLACFFTLIFLVIGSSAWAAETDISASVDRTELYETQLLNLTIQADSELDTGPLGGLMNFGGRQIESPEFDNIEQDWEVIDRQQSYNMRSVNGKSTSTITWRYTLSPKRAGMLDIPTARFKSAETEAIAVNVLAGSPPRDATNPPSIFMRAEVDKTSAYVQEQITLTVSLFTLGQVVNGDMSEPSHPDLITENLGDTTKAFRMAYNRRYEVYERTYLLFPQKSGTIRIDPQSFSGTFVPTGARRPMRAREVSNAIELAVKAPPSNFSGDTWLPATSLFVNESLSTDIVELPVGESVTRKIEMKALGLLGSALPPLPTINSPLLKVYPDQPETSSNQHSSGAEATRVETSALVAIKEGQVELPEIRIPWWDTVNDVERVAIVPARSIKIVPGTASSPGPTSPLQNSAAAIDQNGGSAGTRGIPDEASSTLNNDQPIADESNVSSRSLESANQDWHWYLIVFSLVIAWATHVMLIRRSHSKPTPTRSDKSIKSLRQLKQNIRQNNSDTSGLVCQFLSDHFERPVYNLEQVLEIDSVLHGLLVRLDTLTYGSQSSGDSEALSKTDRDSLEEIKKEIIKRLAALHKDKGKDNSEHLTPLYPQ